MKPVRRKTVPAVAAVALAAAAVVDTVAVAAAVVVVVDAATAVVVATIVPATKIRSLFSQPAPVFRRRFFYECPRPGALSISAKVMSGLNLCVRRKGGT